VVFDLSPVFSPLVAFGYGLAEGETVRLPSRSRNRNLKNVPLFLVLWEVLSQSDKLSLLIDTLRFAQNSFACST
jgi:hypothetical protein